MKKIKFNYKFTLDDIKVIVREALFKFELIDNQLIRYGVSEWAIAHRIAIYLEEQLPRWDVDCEYNRQGIKGDVKKIHATNKNIRPDIVVHQRGHFHYTNNLFVVEIKKRSDNADDLEKINEFVSSPNTCRDGIIPFRMCHKCNVKNKSCRPFQYQFGFSISCIGSCPKITCVEMENRIIDLKQIKSGFYNNNNDDYDDFEHVENRNNFDCLFEKYFS